ncbi:LPS export ABC transporter permease LptG [Brevundimonas sp.]|uniref:LPS export ABC transporter permease LptG n=1 Tax=Brevundimonas sp. TaxID=1871086 RepID=UPI002FCB0DAC
MGLPLKLGRIERYVLGQQLKALGVALAIIAALVMLIDFVEVSRGLNSDGELSGFKVLSLIAVKSPSVIVQLLPFVFLFGTLGAFVSLNRRSELIAMRAAGVSAWRFVLPAAACAFILGVVTVTAIAPLAAWGDSVWQSERGRIRGGVSSSEEAQPVWLREGDETRQMIIRGERQDRTTGQLLDATFFIYSIDAKGERRFTERVDAKTATLTAGRWRLTDVVGGQGGQQAVHYATLDLPSDLADDEAFQQFERPQSLSIWSLPGQIRRIDSAGFASTAYDLRFQQLLATPLMFAAMSILAAAFSLRLMRLGDMARMAVSAVVLGFGFFFVNQFSAAMGSAEVIPAFLAAWLPAILTALAALTLLFYTEDG